MTTDDYQCKPTATNDDRCKPMTTDDYQRLSNNDRKEFKTIVKTIKRASRESQSREPVERANRK